ncbi:MAG: hypothetical protein DMG40_13495 [Acidobacteria bacterium]|nr:MAG: hypothetical protein DMG40_13495 [Acidobacteriota bacterium]
MGQAECGDSGLDCVQAHFGGLRDTPGTSNRFPQYQHHAYQSRGNFWKETSVRRLWNEVFAVTEMTWDNADIADSGPVTSCFARKVGEILSYIPETEEPHPSYRGPLERTFARHPLASWNISPCLLRDCFHLPLRDGSATEQPQTAFEYL